MGMKSNVFNILLFFFFATFIMACSGSNEMEEVITGNGIIYGRIVDEDTTDPIQGASITIYPGGKTTVTGNNGQYEFTALTDGSYIIQISKKGYLSKAEFTSASVANLNTQVDVTLSKGEACLNIMLGELDFGDNSSSKAFIISNNGNKSIAWSLYSDYHKFLSFDKTSGNLQPNENIAINVSILRMGTSAEVKFFPIYIYAEGEELGAIATVNRIKGGLSNSLLIGTWTLINQEFWQENANDITYNTINTENVGYFTINNNFTFERYEKMYVNNGLEKLDNMLNYYYENGEFSYDQANGMIQLGEYGDIYQINNLTKDYLELETPQFQNQKEGVIVLYKRCKK